MTSPSAPGRATTALRLTASLFATGVVLLGCGGGGGGSSPVSGTRPDQSMQQPPANPTVPTDPIAAPGAPTAADLDAGTLGEPFQYWNLCAAPRTGRDFQGQAFPDKQGTLLDEMKFLRAWSHRYYLWYDEIPNTYKMADFATAVDYFKVLKTPALTASGRAKDRYHFTYSTEEWEKMTTAGLDLGYGVTFKRNTGANIPRTWLVTLVEPGSPAANAGVQRGDMLLRIDGIDFVSTADADSVKRINAALFPEAVGTPHQFSFQRAGAVFDVTMTALEVSVQPVKHAKVLETPTGKVGYLSFETFNAVSERQLVDTFTTFSQAGVNDLVLDLRYNGGGLLYVASELSYMIAGPDATRGKVFERPQYNDKTAPQPAIDFLSTAYGFKSPNPVRAGTPLPSLNLKRVTVLTTSGSCSASEAVINGLRGADIEVNVIGGQTCGKPYGFTPVPNCGTTYFSIEFKGVNNKGFGDFPDGLAPTCQVEDDLSRPIGDPAEGLLAAALAYRQSGTCPTSSARARNVPMEIVRPAVQEISIYSRPRQ
ncbi:S41 family peptidase [Massilia sp. H6]|uniref:S41 family peptidase n=1 Tax=Massilia sp. H6 TaxID=2970464 RepID=UPI002169FEA9|nr:S41 family peptidase [Massilia sp. H6]UVW29002.1 S41 family peptidase [Massilia sp. H6]